MNNLYKVTSKYILLSFPALLVYTLTVQSKNYYQSTYAFHNNLTADDDTIIPPGKKLFPQRSAPKIKTDTIPVSTNKKDTGIINKDSVTTFVTADTVNIKFSKDSLDAPIEYTAEDSMIMDVPSKKITLYGKKTTTHYKDNDLSAPIIEFDQEAGVITASIMRDSTGKIIAMPVYKQADFVSESDSIKFNIKSGKGITKSTYTQQGEMFVYGEVFKKVTNDIFFAQRARITTCNLDTPHFAFVSNRLKVVNKKLAITGPVHPEFEGIPIPIYLPFGIYPLSQGRHSGFLAPTFSTNEQLGLGLEGLGYYKVLGPHWDIVTRANIYSYGGWTLSVNPRYTKRYRYNGTLTLDYQSFKYNFKGDPDFSKNKSFHIAWSHAADSKARPGVNFSANVNAGSSSFNSQIPNNPYKNFSNQLNSSIVYSRTWKDKPFNLTVSANHNQNTNQKIININLPDVAFSVNTIYPFRSKSSVGTPKWYENLGIAYSGNAKSLFSFYDTMPNIFKHILDTLQWGAHHSIPISLSLPQVGAFQFSPNISYDETWYQRKFIRSWDNVNKKVDTSVRKGFYTARDMSFGMGVSTRIFGLITSKSKTARIQAIRHEITPTLSFSYRPDLNKNNYYYTQIDTFNTKAQFSVFEGNIFGAYGSGKFGGINFGIDNNIQMKVRSKKPPRDGIDSATAEGESIKKISILDGLSINGSYNLVADSFNFSPLSVNARSSLFNSKLNITAGATLDPYDVDARGNRKKTLIWSRKPLSFGRLVSGNISISSQFQGGSKDKSQSNKTDLRTNDYPRSIGYTADEYQTELAYIHNNPAEYADFNIPWSVNVSYSLRFDKVLKPDYSGLKTDYNQDLNFNGSLNLTPKWQMGVNGFYNITHNQLGTLSLTISREMHCWQMAIALSPVGRYRFYSITISPKSALLRDLRINRTRSTVEGL